MSPMVIKIAMLSMLSICWLALFQKVKRLDANLPFHVAAERRDRRKARFYYHSVWIGLAVTFLSLLCSDALANADFSSGALRELVNGLVRTAGVWGLLIVGAVWHQVGQRASQPNLDGQSLIPQTHPMDSKRPNDRQR